MSEEQRRVQLVNELRAALEEIAQVSDRMSALLSDRALDHCELENLRGEMHIAKALASQLRSAIDSLDASADREDGNIALGRP